MIILVGQTETVSSFASSKQRSSHHHYAMRSLEKEAYRVDAFDFVPQAKLGSSLVLSIASSTRGTLSLRREIKREDPQR